MGLQSNVLLEKTEGPKCQNTYDTIVEHKIVIKMTAVMSFVMPLVIFDNEFLQLLMVGSKFGSPIEEEVACDF